MKQKVVIIGAGPAGLTAGVELLRKNAEAMGEDAKRLATKSRDLSSEKVKDKSLKGRKKADEKVKYEVMILEESGEIGGISRTVRYKGNRMDIGGHRFFSKDERVVKFWKELMPVQGEPSYDDKVLGREKSLEEGGPDPEKEDEVLLIRERVSRIYYLKRFFDYPISMKLQTFKNMGLPRTVAAGTSYLKSMAVKRPEDSLENFYINRFGEKLYSMFFEGYTEKLWGRHPSEISADWGAQRVKGLSIAAVLKDMMKKVLHINNGKVETSLIEEFMYPKYGPGQLWETVAKEFEKLGGKIVMNAKVTGIHKKRNKIEAVSYVLDDEGIEEVKKGRDDGKNEGNVGEKNLGKKQGKKNKTIAEKAKKVVAEKAAKVKKVASKNKAVELKGDIFISSMPLKDLVEDMNNVPKEIKAIATGLPYRDFVTVGLLVKKLNLKNETNIRTLGNIVPDCWIYVQEPDVKLGRIQIFNNWSPYLVENVDETVWIGLEYFCNEGDEFWNMSDEECIKFATDELVKMGVIKEGDVLDAHRERVKKAYPAYFDTYEQIDELVEYLSGIKNLYCVGRNGQHRYNNMDHSMVTAFETVKNIVSGEEDKSNIWSVNTEKEYHEEK